MIINFLKKIYYSKYTKKSYSISNVDLIIDRMFANKKSGNFIDLGCNHPIKFNNTYLLYKRGWRGLNIDLDETSINEFNKIRKFDFNVQALISNSSNQSKKVYFYHKRSAINTVSDQLIKYRKSKKSDYKIIEQKTKTLNEIIDNSPLKDKNIDLLSIDIENHEYEVLENFDFKKYKIDVIVTECHDLGQNKLEIYNQNIENIINNKLYNHLVSNNYKLINWVNSDLIFVRNNFNLS
ncbi:FkbM family methyltransferase [Candidatus Pelagibacter sp.]|nr:FkbM family methyltransferase [Candidatus Pelagibacter sp.]